MRTKLLLTVPFLSTWTLARPHRHIHKPAKPTPEQILKWADDARSPQGTFSLSVRVIDKDGGKTERETVYRVYSQGMRKSLVETLEPERQSGRKLLMAKGLWMYLPTVRKPTRVSPQQRVTGEVANGDLARTQFSADYKAALEAEENWGGIPCYRLGLTSKTRDAPYRRVRLWVDKAKHFPLRAEYFALSGKLLKTGVFSEPEPVLGAERVTKLVIQDALNPKKESHLKYSDFKRETLPASFFNKESLAE